jgi:hypothetical protein
MLSALQSFPTSSSIPSSVSISTPQLYHFQEDANIEVIQYLPNTTTLKEAIHSLSSMRAFSIGHSLGSWLRAFHHWTSVPEQNDLVEKIRANVEMRALKQKITFEQGHDILCRFPDIFGEKERTLWGAIRAAHGGGLGLEEPDTKDDGWGIIHGDLWTGKYVTFPLDPCILCPYINSMLSAY